MEPALALAFAALFTLTLTGLLVMVLERPRPPAGAAAIDGILRSLEHVGVDPGAPLTPSAWQVQSDWPGDEVVLVVTFRLPTRLASLEVSR